jgi:16S rRNA (cytosine967-C5)-methyltransferase
LAIENPRIAAVKALADVHRHEKYSNIAWEEFLKNTALSEQDKSLASRLFYGVIERKLTLDYVLCRFCTMPLKKLHPLVLETLRVAVYQLLYMDKIPVSATVNEAVAGIRRLKQGQASGFVNGVLRNIVRKKEQLFDKLPDNDKGLSIRYSCPEELIAFWRKSYGDSLTIQLLCSINETPDSYIRLNTLQTSDEEFSEKLTKQGISHQILSEIPHCFRLNRGYLLNKLEYCDKNCYYYQDMASQIECFCLGAVPGEQIIDVCAAPGGKSLTVAQYMENKGTILACDIYPAKCEVMQQRAFDFGISSLKTAVRDASLACDEEQKEKYDRVICDVPCSGLGVIRRKPEIRYKAFAEFKELPQLQYTILEQSAQLVKPGGVLQYSTCTLNPAENEQVTGRFLHEHPEFEPKMLPILPFFEAAGLSPSHQITLFPPIHKTDGFYIAAFRKK